MRAEQTGKVSGMCCWWMSRMSLMRMSFVSWLKRSQLPSGLVLFFSIIFVQEDFYFYFFKLDNVVNRAFRINYLNPPFTLC